MEPARTNGGSVWECQLCTFVERCGRIVLPDMSRTAGLCATGALPTSCTALSDPFRAGSLGLVESARGRQRMCAVHQRCLMAQGTWSCASCTCLNPEGPAPLLHRMRRGARGWRCGRRAYRRALRRDGRRRPIEAVDAGRVATGDWQRRGCGGTMHSLYVASAHGVLYVVFWDLGGRLTAPPLQRRVGVDMGGSVTCVRGGCAHAQTQAVHAVNVPPNSHAPSKRPAHTYTHARTYTAASRAQL